MKKIVFDTNVLVSASLLNGSVPFLAFKKGLEKCQILRSEALVKEFFEIISCPKFDKYFPSTEIKYELLLSFLSISRNIKVKDKVDACRDKKDNMLLELALSGKADVIVTGDKDLLELNPFRDIKILSPGAFIKQ